MFFIVYFVLKIIIFPIQNVPDDFNNSMCDGGYCVTYSVLHNHKFTTSQQVQRDVSILANAQLYQQHLSISFL